MRLFFGSGIAVVLLGLYVYAVEFAMSVVNCVTTSGCTSPTAQDFTDGFAGAITTIGGLVSALVIAELAVTEPGTAPVARALGASRSVTAARWLKAVTFLYLAIWVLAGLTAYVIGVMKHPGVLQPLTDTGRSWLGLAVAAGYSYFAINPRAREPAPPPPSPVPRGT